MRLLDWMGKGDLRRLRRTAGELESAFAPGMVTGKDLDRAARRYGEVLRREGLPLPPQCSGGPLLNDLGEVVGVPAIIPAQDPSLTDAS